MIRTFEKDVSWKAGGLAIAVHLALIGALLISFNWKASHPVLNVAEVELWDSIPEMPTQKSSPIVNVEQDPITKNEPKPEPKPVMEDKPIVEPKVDIALENKKKELEQKNMAEKLKQEKFLEQKKQLDALKIEMRKDEVRNGEKPIKDKSAKDALKKIQQETLDEEKLADDQQALSVKAASNAGVLDEYKSKIQAKIRGNVNKSLCGDGNPELRFDIGLLPTGELNGNPKITKSSGSAACDEAVERAIMVSEPLPLPSDKSLFSQFRNLKLKFRPND